MINFNDYHQLVTVSTINITIWTLNRRYFYISKTCNNLAPTLGHSDKEGERRYRSQLEQTGEVPRREYQRILIQRTSYWITLLRDSLVDGRSDPVNAAWVSSFSVICECVIDCGPLRVVYRYYLWFKCKFRTPWNQQNSPGELNQLTRTVYWQFGELLHH